LRKYTNLIIQLGILAVTLAVILFSINSVHGSPNGIQTPPDVKTPEQTGPPWFNDAWQYRRQVSISNSGAALGYYQVLLKLDGDNFDFSLTKMDGSDIRFTHSDGTTELSYWIESWNYAGELAYIWIKVPSLASGETTIYLYYHNPNAETTSSGTATFDGFDNNWSQFTGLQTDQDGLVDPQPANVIENPFTWSSIGTPPSVSAGILSLSEGSAIKSTSPYLYNAVGMRVNFENGTGNKWGGFINGATGQRTMIGDLASDPDNLYLINSRSANENILIPRDAGVDWHNSFHVYEVRWNQNLSVGDVDHGISTAITTQPLVVPNAYLPVTFYSYVGSNAQLSVDWVYLRQYRDPEPSVTLGEPQSLLNLALNMADSPDPLPSGHALTYQLSITNSSSIAAPGVVVTDTLPIDVSFSSVDPSQGSCVGGGVVVCNMGAIPAYSNANIELVVIPTLDGKVTNTAIVGSLGYDMDMSDNWDDTDTLVDSIPPNVNWESPVHNGGDYTTYGGLINLEASATDNDQVASVEFLWYDHIPNPGVWISIGTDYTYPYQMQFDSDILEPNVRYQMFVKSTDRAGNQSNPLNPLVAIYVQRSLVLLTHLPIIIK
jgi:uncharacterized repeat protein (TIGR01451 family)